MTVNELKELLDQFDGDMEVHFSYSYGDRWGTKVTSKIKDVDETMIDYSSYHGMTKVSDDEDEDSKMVVLIS